MDNISVTLVYTTHIQSTCTKVGRHAPYRPKRVRKRRGSLGLLCPASHHPIDHAVCGGGDAGPVPSLTLSAATGAQWWFVLRAAAAAAEHAAVLANRTSLRAANPAKCRLFGYDLGGGDDWRRLRAFRRGGLVVSDRDVPVKGSVGSALSSAREKARRCEASGQGGAGRRAHGGQALKLAGGGKDRPLTRVRRAEKSSACSSFSSRGSWKASVAAR